VVTLWSVDVVSDAIAVMRTGRPTSQRLQVGSPWRCRFAPYDGAGFHVLLRGEGWLVPEQAAPVRLSAGDVVLVPYGSGHVLSDGPSAVGAVPFETVAAAADPAAPATAAVDFLCGKYRLDRSRVHPLLAGMPDVVHLSARADDHPELHAAVQLLAREVLGTGAGRDAALAGLLEVLLAYLVRAWLDGKAAESDNGWAHALRDPQIVTVLEALHAQPAAPWRLADLAARAGLSRTALARRFGALTGQSPMAYLTWWRMATAARLLRETDDPLTAVARRVGYGSSYAFAHAFKRHTGVPPGRYRAQRPAGTPAEEEPAVSPQG
jgi:AraC-like DNA-binding protein